jgi:hypothetical protein
LLTFIFSGSSIYNESIRSRGRIQRARVQDPTRTKTRMATSVIFSQEEAVKKGREAVDGERWRRRRRRRRTHICGYRGIAGYSR